MPLASGLMNPAPLNWKFVSLIVANPPLDGLFLHPIRLVS